jgi:hypothetical protein
MAGMRWPARLEFALRTLIEGGLGRLLGARIQPVDIARRLADHMDDHRVVGAGRVYVPNSYRGYLAPRTLANFAASQRALEDDLCAFLNAHAGESGYSLVGRLRVSLLEDAGVPAEQVRVEADLVDRHGMDMGPNSEHTRAIQVPTAQRHEAEPPLVLVAAGRSYPLPVGRAVTVGRALDNDIILDSPSISRHHARLSPRSNHWLVEDLASTHGLYVNGRRVSASLLRPGDELRLGTVAAVVSRASVERS